MLNSEKLANFIPPNVHDLGMRPETFIDLFIHCTTASYMDSTLRHLSTNTTMMKVCYVSVGPALYARGISLRP
jgi:hypothetical protein